MTVFGRVISVLSTALLLLLLVNRSTAFAPRPTILQQSWMVSPSSSSFSTRDYSQFINSNSLKGNNVNFQKLPGPLQRQRHSVASTQTMGIFGLGFAEIAIVLVVVAFVLGPQTIGRLAGSTLKQADALKEELAKVPDEFKKGLEEGEMDARSRKAKPMQQIKDVTTTTKTTNDTD